MENLTSDTFDKTIAENSMLILDFWAPWCGPCRAFGPVFEKSSKAHSDIYFAKVNVDEQPEIASKFGVRSIPTIVAIKNQTVVFNQAGMLREGDLDKLVEELKKLI